jgi:hypothetical protein
MVKHLRNVDHKLSVCSPMYIYSGLTKKEQMDKLDEIDHPIAFIPKAMIDDKELAGLLARLAFRGLPILPKARQWQEFQKVCIKAYSCGYSSGFTPDSHVSPCWHWPTLEPFPEAKLWIIYHRLHR